MSDTWVLEDLNSTLKIRTLSNKIEGVFTLYAVGKSEVESTLIVKVKESYDLISYLNVKVQREADLNSTIDIRYRGTDDFNSYLDVIGSTYLDSYLEIRPNNRMFGIFEILPPPRVVKGISSTEDSTTRSREDLMTINYGDSQRMMVGRSLTTQEGDEFLESFIKFGTIMDDFQDLSILELANLRLYYAGDFIEGTDLSLYLPDTKWLEYGITHANKPNPIELITNAYTHNSVEKYVEFDIKEIVLRWLSGSVNNFGLIISSSNNFATSFYTREGRLKPVLNIQYITNKVYSLGRTELNSTLFIYGVGHAELNSRLTVHSDYGFEWFESTLYVHRYEVPVPNDLNAKIATSRPDQQAKLTVAKRDTALIDGTLTVFSKQNEEKQTRLSVSKPDFNACLTVDPNISLESTLMIRFNLTDEKEGTLAVTREEIYGFMRIIGVDQSNIEANIEVPNYSHIETILAVSRDELYSFLDVHTINEQEATLYIKEREEITGTLIVKEVSELSGILDIKYMVQIDAKLTVSKKNLVGFLYPRVSGEHDINSFAYIRQRDASDLTSYLSVGGSFGAYYFII